MVWIMLNLFIDLEVLKNWLKKEILLIIIYLNKNLNHLLIQIFKKILWIVRINIIKNSFFNLKAVELINYL